MGKKSEKVEEGRSWEDMKRAGLSWVERPYRRVMMMPAAGAWRTHLLLPYLTAKGQGPLFFSGAS
jgi:hypothetical protein